MVANSALFVNFFFILGVLASFQAALTMSGIAGMVLTLGMAVDANVLIFERTKEELAAGKKLKSALADGYSNAFSAIVDSNVPLSLRVLSCSISVQAPSEVLQQPLLLVCWHRYSLQYG